MDVPLSKQEIEDFYNGKTVILATTNSYYCYWKYITKEHYVRFFHCATCDRDRSYEEIGYTNNVENIWSAHNSVFVCPIDMLNHHKDMSRRYISCGA